MCLLSWLAVCSFYIISVVFLQKKSGNRTAIWCRIYLEIILTEKLLVNIYK